MKYDNTVPLYFLESSNVRVFELSYEKQTNKWKKPNETTKPFEARQRTAQRTHLVDLV